MSFRFAVPLLTGLLFWGTTMSALAEERLSLLNYQKQVMDQNLNYRAGLLQIEAFTDRMFEGSTDFMPSLLGGLNYNDNKQIQPSILYGTDTLLEVGNLAVQTKLRTGTLVNVGYIVNYSATYGSPFIPSQGFYTASPVITITQPLWKDFNAHLSKANEEATQENYQTQILLQKFSNQQTVFNAQTAYWRLALNREIIKFDRDAIDRADKNNNLTSKRVRMNVADRADLLQTLAALKLRQLQYENDLESLRQASSTFNSLRNISGDEVKENIAPLDKSDEEYIVKEIQKRTERYDTTAAVMTAKNQAAIAKLNVEKNKPDISIFGSVQLNGRGGDIGTAAGESWNADNPTYGAGLKLTIPLDAGLIDHINQGYNSSAMAADLLARRAQFDLSQDWNDLKKHLKDAVVRLDMARDLEKLQEEKLKHEKVRLGAGRTTSFQVLQFEDNFSDAETSRLRIQNEIVTIFAQAVLYNGGSL